MTKTLVLGASGQIARHVVQDIAGDDGIGMTLFMRDAGKLSSTPRNASVVQGDVLDRSVCRCRKRCLRHTGGWQAGLPLLLLFTLFILRFF
ncbi:NAD(P)H-binding protein [Agrobacterium sp. 22-221-1]